VDAVRCVAALLRCCVIRPKNNHRFGTITNHFGDYIIIIHLFVWNFLWIGHHYVRVNV